MKTISPIDDKPREECAVFGISNHKDAAQITALGLHALQHRGQEATGMAVYDGDEILVRRNEGLVGDVFSAQGNIELSNIGGFAAIGHNRYSTSGKNGHHNSQPIYADLKIGGLAMAHNGQFINARRIRHELVDQGSIFQSTTDTETLMHLIAKGSGNILARLQDALSKIKGGYALVILTEQGVYGARDPVGIRPLILGKLGDAHIICSETVGLDIIGAEFVREIAPGEIIHIANDGKLKSVTPGGVKKAKPCLFEFVYFSRPDSFLHGKSIYEVRKNMGAQLAAEYPIDADVVVPIPDSGNPAALGYAQALDIPFEFGIIRNHYVGRTFIEPTSSIRNLGVKLKHNANRNILAGKDVVLIDDSLVRGTTSGKIVQMVRDCGARKVYMCVASPPVKYPCYYGIDMPDTEELLAHNSTIEEIAKLINVDGLYYLSIEGLYRALGEARRNADDPQYTDHYFTGHYPIAPEDENFGVEKQQSLFHVINSSS